jgi:Trpc4-associated protein
VGVVEELLAVREQTYPLGSVAALPQLISGFSAKQLACFCRLLSSMVYEPDDHLPELGTAAAAAAEVSREADAQRADANHAALLRVPTILHRLVALLRSHALPPSATRPGASPLAASSLSGEVVLYAEDWDQYAEWMAALEATGAMDSHTVTHTPASLEALTMATLQAEVLFVLCALLGGTCKVQVQDELASEEGFMDGLSSMFRSLDWTTRSPPRHGTAAFDNDRHGPECACNPASALKVQLLRLVHNFCDRDRCAPPYSDAKVANRDSLGFWHGATEKAP